MLIMLYIMVTMRVVCTVGRMSIMAGVTAVTVRMLSLWMSIDIDISANMSIH